MEQMNKKEILDILDNAKDEKGSVPMRLVRQALDKLPTIQPVATDTNVGDTISRKGVFIPNITVEMFRNASLVGVEDLMVSGEMEDISLPSAQSEKQHGRIFQEIIVEYPTYCIYPEYKGKPYFSIKYTKNGQEFIGYGTYKPEVLSEYLKEYFMPSAQPEHTCVNCGRTVNNGGRYADGETRCPIEEHYALPKDGFCHLWEKRNVTDDDYPERREE